MNLLPNWLRTGYLRLVDPVADWLVRHHVQPNTITTIGTLCAVASGAIYASGHIRTGGWFLGLTAVFDVLDGIVARRTNQSSRFGAFYDSTLDRVADGCVLGGLAVFFATMPPPFGVVMVAVSIAGLMGTFLTSYTRARAEALGVDVRSGVLQRPERVVLLSAPQAFFGLALHGWVLGGIVAVLAVTAWLTAAHRVMAVHRVLMPERTSALRLTRDARGWSADGWSRVFRTFVKGE